MGQTGLPGHSVEDVQPPLFGWLRDRFDETAVDGNVREDRCARQVPIQTS